jgi:hypothetical protein
VVNDDDNVAGISVTGTGALLVDGTAGAPILSAREDMVVVKLT